MSQTPVDPTACSGELSNDEILAMASTFQWFAHTDLGEGVVARSTSWPDAPDDSPHMGVPKFEFIVRRNLPDLGGLRVLDLGCNAGVIARHMIRLGAREVVGVDSKAHWPRWLEQAHFVKRVTEQRTGKTINVQFVDADLALLPTLDLGHFDVVVALNSLYYLSEDAMRDVMRHVSANAGLFLVQCNTRDHGRLGRRPTPGFMRAELASSGFPHTWIDAPWDRPRWRILPQRYHRPVAVGSHAWTPAARRASKWSGSA